jgi:hypothetical protein
MPSIPGGGGAGDEGEREITGGSGAGARVRVGNELKYPSRQRTERDRGWASVRRAEMEILSA